MSLGHVWKIEILYKSIWIIETFFPNIFLDSALELPCNLYRLLIFGSIFTIITPGIEDCKNRHTHVCLYAPFEAFSNTVYENHIHCMLH